MNAKAIFGCGLGIVTLFALGACSTEQKKELGLMKKAPDEFAVVTRAPLSQPPEYTLRPPRPGAGRPNEAPTVERARQTVFGVEDVRPEERSEPTPEFLEKIGVNEADRGIRERLEDENKTYVEENKPVAEKLLFWRNDDEIQGDILDPKEEMERMQQEGDSVPATDELSSE